MDKILSAGRTCPARLCFASLLVVALLALAACGEGAPSGEAGPPPTDAMTAGSPDEVAVDPVDAADEQNAAATNASEPAAGAPATGTPPPDEPAAPTGPVSTPDPAAGAAAAGAPLAANPPVPAGPEAAAAAVESAAPEAAAQAAEAEDAGADAAPAAAGPPTTHTIKGVVTRWDPAVLFVQPGDTIVFRQMIGHDTELVAGMHPEGVAVWKSKLGEEGFAITLTEPGAYVHKCNPHVSMGMIGTIVVGPRVPHNLAAIEAHPENKGMYARAIRMLKQEIEKPAP